MIFTRPELALQYLQKNIYIYPADLHTVMVIDGKTSRIFYYPKFNFRVFLDVSSWLIKKEWCFKRGRVASFGKGWQSARNSVIDSIILWTTPAILLQGSLSTDEELLPQAAYKETRIESMYTKINSAKIETELKNQLLVNMDCLLEKLKL